MSEQARSVKQSSHTSLKGLRPATSSGRVHSQYIISLLQERTKSSQVTCVTFDLFIRECVIYHYVDTQTFSKTLYKIYSLDPTCILIPVAMETNRSKLYLCIQESFPDVTFVPLQKRFYSDQIGLDHLSHYAIHEQDALVDELSSIHSALIGISSIFGFLESDESFHRTHHSIRFRTCPIDGTMMMDVKTATQLELVENRLTKDGPCLLHMIKQTTTPMGFRLLKMSLLQPLCSSSMIEARLDMVQLLTDRPECRSCIRNVLKKMCDFDHLISSFHVSHASNLKHAEQSINRVLSMKQMLILMNELREPIEILDCSLAKNMFIIFSNSKLNDLRDEIDLIINEDITFQKGPIGLRNQRCMAVKSGFNGLLDVARQTYKETMNDVHELIQFYSEKYKLNLKTNYESTTGFTMSIHVNDLNNGTLPIECIHVVQKRKLYTFTTLKLMGLNERMKESLAQVYLMSDEIILDLNKEIQSNSSLLYKCSECIAMLDMLSGFAQYNTQHHTVRPEFTDTFALKAAQHPMKSNLVDSFVSNDSFASLENNFILVTGPNMSGKTTYLSQMALLTIMSHMGSFVPAHYASFRITDALFTRMGNDDSLQSNCSSFMVEMKDMSHILQNVTDDSLVFIDELGRGTSTQDGLGITFSICEVLELTKLLIHYPNVMNVHLTCQMMDSPTKGVQMKYHFSVQDGICEQEHYGIELAKLSGLSFDILMRAQELSFHLEQQTKHLEFDETNESSRIEIQFLKRVVYARKCWSGSEEGLLVYLKGLYNDLMEKLNPNPS